MKKLPAPTAQNINEAHQCARESMENAVEWAVKCGQLLAAKKAELKHGEFMPWVEKHCDFSIRTASDYMRGAAKYAENGSTLPFSSLRQLLAPPADQAAKPKREKPVDTKTAPEPFAEDRAPRPESTSKPAAEPEFIPAGAPGQLADASSAGDFDFTDYEPEDDEAYKQNIENVMMADDKLAAMREELKQVHRELQAVKASRDHYQSEAGAAVRLVKLRDREIEKLKRELAKLRGRAAA
jgi:hypothetical protein